MPARNVFVCAVFCILCFAPLDAAGQTLSLPLSVRETAGIARDGEIAQNGIPLAAAQNLLSTASLVVQDPAGTPVPAEFEVLARWNAAKSDSSAPIQWLLVTFPASVGANQTVTYTLMSSGVNPTPTPAVQVTQAGSQLTVNTGRATFVIDSRTSALFRGDELDCSGDNDPTPGQDWDNTYWCATWTDYHNTTALAAYYAMRSGKVEWLDEITTPAALRMLYTQMMQCAAEDSYFYCGQAPAGYGGYRTDFNSSHAYLDNLFLYYWLSGDSSVVDLLKRGATQMRQQLCTRRPGAACQPTDAPTDEWSQLAGRTAMQWFAIFRFVGLASSDGSFLDDYTSGLARAVSQYYVEANANGKAYGFWVEEALGSAGTYDTAQLWLGSLYDMNMLHRLQRDNGDAAIGSPALAPSRVQAAWARTLKDYGAQVSGNGSAAGAWPNALTFTYSGDRVGGTLQTVAAMTAGDDPYLYDTGKAALSAALARPAAALNDTAMQALSADVVSNSLSAAAQDGAPLGKVPGEYFSRLPAAILALQTAAPAATPTVTPTPAPGVNVRVGRAPAAEQGRSQGIFVLTRTEKLSKSMRVYYALSGSAGNGVDYRVLPGSALFRAGASTFALRIAPLDDHLREGTERVRLTLLARPGSYRLGRQKSATLSITDND